MGFRIWSKDVKKDPEEGKTEDSGGGRGVAIVQPIKR